MKFSLDAIIDFVYEHYKTLLLGLIVVLQLVVFSQISHLSVGVYNMEKKMDNIQTLMGVSSSPDTQEPIVQRGILNPIQEQKGMLPIRPDNTLEVAYIEKGYSELDNYYPLGKAIIYANQKDISEVGDIYKMQLINTGWQVLDIKDSGVSGNQKTHILSMKATNGQSTFRVEFLEKLNSYNKKAGSFIKIILEK